MNLVLVLILALSPFLAFTQEGDEALIEEIQENREERAERLQAISEIGNNHESGLTLTPEEQLKKLGYGPVNPAALLNLEALNMMEKILADARMWEQPEEVVRTEVIRSFQGTAVEGYIRTSPKLVAFMVDFLRDKEALYNAIQIFKNRPRLKIYLYFWIGIMFAAYYTKRLFVSKYWAKPAKVFAGLLFSCTISVITLSTFCLIFDEEMKPIISVVKRHL